MKNIAIIGSGSWGVALAIHLVKLGNKIKIWSFSEEEMVDKEPDKTGQWWIIMTVVATLLTLMIAGAAFVIARHKKMPF